VNRPVSTTKVQAQNVGVWYKNQKREDFRSLVLDALHGRRKKKLVSWAVQGVDFSADQAQVLGIIGANGAGKSTICRVIARVLRPDEGSISIQGRVSALLSMGAGFNLELTGKENILLNGLLLGYSKHQMDKLYPDIAEFSELGQFITEPVKKYSSGMRSRLGFSIASSLHPEILVLDEVLGAGDLSFGTKAATRMRQVVQGAHMVIVVSHSMDFITKTCDRALWVEKGRVVLEGKPEEITQAYLAKVVPPKPAGPAKVVPQVYEAPQIQVGSKVVARVENLGIRFKIGNKPFMALEDVSFLVNQGDILGIVGHNGAGKSTLCRALTRIYRPDIGKVETSNKVSTLLSMGTGFNSQLDAWDNIMLNGLMLGISKKKMARLRQGILEFAELTEHRHKQVKNYSNGMRSRLAFSIAVAVDPSLLIIDEALTAGDASFKEKASQAMEAMIDKAEAVVIVSHNLQFIESVCTRAIWLDHGRLMFDGDAKETVQMYKQNTQK